MTWWAKLLIISALAAAAIGGWVWVDHSIRTDERTIVNNEWQVKVDKLKLEAAATLADEKDKTRAIELKWSEFKNQQEVKDGKAQQVVAGYKSRIAGLLRSTGGRLRDPNAESGCGSSSGNPNPQAPASASNSAEHTSQTGGLLSEALSGLLAELTSEADQLNIAYASCRADSMNLRLAPTLGQGSPGEPKPVSKVQTD